jgi:transcription termination factor Rho
MPTNDLENLHIADLHARAAEAGIDGFRKLGRDALIDKLGSSGGSSGRRRTRKAPEVDLESDTNELETVSERKPERERPARRRRGGRGGGSRERERLGRDRSDEREGDREEAETHDVAGVLEVTRQRHGFLSLTGEHEGEPDVYVSAAQVRRCELKSGDEVAGPAREPRRGERHPALVHVDKVNGEDPLAEPTDSGRPDFDSLTAVPPTRRIEIPADAEPLVRAADMMAPLALGQRVLVRSTPRSGRTTLLRGLAKAIDSGETEAEIVLLLIDERPEELTAWNEALPDADVVAAPADLAPADQVRAADRALERARRHVEAGVDVVLLVDSLSRLAIAADGVDQVKRLFGSGRELEGEESGSLTVIATAFSDGDDEGSADRAVSTTENALIVLDPDLAAHGIVPALRAGECRSTGEDGLLSEEELGALRSFRGELAGLDAKAAAALLSEKLG